MNNIHGILGSCGIRMRSVAVVSMVSAGLVLAGCGQKGPLFIPKTVTQKPPMVQPSDSANRAE